MGIDAISLLVLCATLALAFLCKRNSGLVSIAVSLLFAKLVGIEEKFLINSFNNSLFLMLLGVMYLFSIAQENKTLEILAKKTFALFRGSVRAMPIVIFVVAAVLSALGPGLISVTALVSVLVVALAKEMQTAPIRLIPFGLLGAFAGGLSPITPTGIIAVNLAEKHGIAGVGMEVAWKMALTCILFAAILYIFVFRWYKKPQQAADNTEAEAIPALTLMQILTMVGIAVVAIVTSVFKVNVGLISFAVAVVLTLVGAADEGAALKKVPWNTLVMITGVGILISVVTEVGGIELLSSGLSELGTDKTIAAIMALLSGVMSWVSSASGVVMPTLIPTVPDMVQTIAGASATELVNCISIGANMAALSPLSTCGALMLAAYSTADGVDAKDRNRMFAQLFLLSASGVLLSGLCALVGLY